MKAMAETGVLCVDGHEYARVVGADKLDTNSLNRRLDWLSLVKRVVDALHFKPELNVSALTDQDLKNIEAMQHGIVDGELLHYKNRQNGFGLLDLCGHKIKLVFHQEETDMYRMSDALQLDEHTVAVYTYGSNEEDREIVAPLFVLTAEEYGALANIDAAVFAASLEKWPITEISASYCNDKMLQMLLAYDAGACCANELLECCLLTAKALESFTDAETTLINRCQIAARFRELTEDERDELVEIQMNSTSIQAKACAAALRGDRDVALALLSKLDKEDRKAFETWPIMRFLK